MPKPIQEVCDEAENFWMLHIGDQNDNPLVFGIKLITDWPLIRREQNMLNGDLSLTLSLLM